MKGLYLFLCLAGLCATVFAQPPQEKILADALGDITKESFISTDSTLIASFELATPSEKEKLLTFFEEQIKKQKNLHAVARSLAWKGIILYRPPFNNSKSGAQALDLAISKAMESSDEYLMVDVFEFCAYTFMSFGNAQKALFYFLRSAELRKKLGDRFFLQKDVKVLGTLSDLLYQVHDYPQALQYIRETIAQPFTGHNPYMTSMNTLGLAYQSLGQYDSALYWYGEALQLATTEQNIVWQGIISGNMGAAYFEQGNDDLALPLLWKDYRLTLADEPNNAGNTLHRLALLYLRKGKSDSALLLARRTLHILTASSRVNPWFLRNGYKAMMEAYLKKDMSDSAFFYSDRYHHLNDSLIQWVAENRADLVQSRLEFEKKSNLINLLLQEKNAEQNRRNFLLAGIILLMITTWLYLRWQKQQHLNKQQQLQYGKEKAEAEIKNARLQLDEFTRNILAKNDLIEQLQQQLAQQHRQVNNELPGQTLLTENDWLRFKEMFDRANPGFLSGLQQQVPDITAAELRLAALMRLNLGNKHIASMLGIGSDAVRKTKSRLRQRLGITVEQNLDDYVRDLAPGETT